MPTTNKALAERLDSLGLHVAEVPHPDPKMNNETICLIVSVETLPRGFYDWLNERLNPGS